MSTTYITFALYPDILLGPGIVARHRTSDLFDYVPGGRKLGSGVTAL